MLEVGVGEALGRRGLLRVDELELVAAQQHRVRAGLRADADPVDPGGRLERAVGLDRDLEARGVERVDGGASSCSSGSPPVQTTSGRLRPFGARPALGDGVGELGGAAELAAVRAVGADEVGVAERADGGRAILLAPVQRLQPAKRQKTAGRPALAPSPCSV